MIDDVSEGFILSVNDDEATRYMVRRVLERAGYRVREATTGGEALAMVREHPKLVILDIKLPDLSGLDVCRRLKADPDTALIPVLQTSATFISPERRIEGLDSGADGYLAQPIEPPELIAHVRALLRTSRAERTAREADSEWRRTFDAIAEPVALFDAGGALIRGNRAFTDFVADGETPSTYEEMVGQFDGAAPPLAVGSRATGEALRNGRTYRLTVDPVDPIGGGVAAMPARFVVVCTDMTEAKRLEELHRNRAEELAEANRRKDEFLAMLAHELRNPLNAIAAAVALHDKISGKSDRTAHLRAAIIRQTKNLSRLVDDLLDVSRITRGRIRLKPEPADLCAVARNIASACQPLLHGRNQELTLELPEHALVVEADVLRLEQAIMNLIANASKFSEVGATIRLAAERREGQAALVVEDDGMGIPTDQLTSVFDMFFQVSPNLVRSRGGLGVGLTITRKLIELHGGTIEARSEGPGKGSAFVICLPLLTRDQELSPPPPPPLVPEAAPSDSRRVLIVEDDHDTADILKELLVEMGHRAAVAYDGSTGLNVALNGEFDVAFVDIGLPGLDGYEIARTLRATRRCERLLLVAVTGYGQPQDRARALESGFDLHIVKPLQPEQLASVLSQREFRQSA
jgi:signal transduction histidine kinase